jgi:hypothetical protein
VGIAGFKRRTDEKRERRFHIRPSIEENVRNQGGRLEGTVLVADGVCGWCDDPEYRDCSWENGWRIERVSGCGEQSSEDDGVSASYPKQGDWLPSGQKNLASGNGLDRFTFNRVRSLMSFMNCWENWGQGKLGYCWNKDSIPT